MAKTSEQLESVLEQCGGLGRFQAIVLTVTLGSKVAVTWSMLMMTFGGATPEWWCMMRNNSNIYQSNNESTVLRMYKSCTPPQNMSDTYCYAHDFSTEMNTVVSQWDLVCDKESISATITTIQMGGLLLSGFLSGQLSDTIGRKPTFFLSLAIMIICNIAAAFSVSWQMFAALRFFIGVGCGCYFSTFFTFTLEFMPKKYRAMIMAIPIWPMFAALYGLVSWWLRDWCYLHYATAIGAVPFLLLWCMIPESFRWLVSNGKLKDAKLVIHKIAITNRKDPPDVTKLFAEIQKDMEEDKQNKHTIFDLFRSADLLKKTFLTSFVWLSCGYGYYGISFGVEELTGSLYINMFLLSIVEIPAQVLTWFLNNKIGRRYTCFGFYMIGAVGAIVVSVIQMADVPHKAELVNAFALTAKVGVAGGWAAFQLLTSESFPTVVRNVGYGLANSSARVGAMVAPQIVLLSKTVSGLLYMACGGVMLLSALCSLLLQETKGKAMEDLIHTESGRDEIGEEFVGEMKGLSSEILSVTTDALDISKNKAA